MENGFDQYSPAIDSALDLNSYLPKTFFLGDSRAFQLGSSSKFMLLWIQFLLFSKVFLEGKLVSMFRNLIYLFKVAISFHPGCFLKTFGFRFITFPLTLLSDAQGKNTVLQPLCVLSHCSQNLFLRC